VNRGSIASSAHQAGKESSLNEANAARGAGLNGCNPHAVVPCIAAATLTPRN
jgi:hypothetical protein